MQRRVAGFSALLFVVAVSIVFGMVVGGRLNAPRVALAASASAPLQLAARHTGGPAPGFADIVESALPAVVGVTSQRQRVAAPGNPLLEDPFFRRWLPLPEEQEDPGPLPNIGAGSGFVIAPEGYILTNNHVVDGFEKVHVRTHDGKRYEAEIVGTDPSIDLALLKIDVGRNVLPVLPLGDSDELRVGEWVIAIGNPLDFELTVTVGVVSGKERRLPSLPTDPGVASFIQTDAAINFGNSGGPLLDGQGNVVGINTAIRRTNFAEGIGFALPINTARNVMDQLRQTGEVRRGYIGIRMNPNEMDQDAADYYGLPEPAGVIIIDVIDDSPAAQAGLREGDIIREVNADSVDDNLDLIGKVAAHAPGARVKLTVYRPSDHPGAEDEKGGESFQANVTLADRKAGLMNEGDLDEEPSEPRDEIPEPAARKSSALSITVENPDERILAELGFDESRDGVVITDVELGSDAAEKGLRPRMLVDSVNEKATPDVEAWEAAMADLAPGRPMKIVVVTMEQGEEQRQYFFLRKPG